MHLIQQPNIIFLINIIQARIDVKQVLVVSIRDINTVLSRILKSVSPKRSRCMLRLTPYSDMMVGSSKSWKEPELLKISS